MSSKQSVQDFWERKSCGEVYAEGDTLGEQLDSHAASRYRLEPYIVDFAGFFGGQEKDVLEIGVGMGADHLEWAKSAPRSLSGIDITKRAVLFTQQRLKLNHRSSRLMIGDAEHLAFRDESFDIVYSWGVLHHTPDTSRAIKEVHRVLRVGGTAKIMIYHKPSIVASLLWLRFGMVRGLGWDEIFSRYIESPGTKAYSVVQAKDMLSQFHSARIQPLLSFGDLLQGSVGQRYEGKLLTLAKYLWPRWFFKKFMGQYGTALLIEAVK